MKLLSRNPFVFAALLAGLCLAPAFARASAPALPDDQIVEAKALLSRDAVRPGETFKAAVILKIRPGYHINDNAPLDEFLIPTALAIADDPAVEVVEISYPAGHRGRFAYSQVDLVVYEGEAVLGVLLKATAGLPAGTLKLKAVLTYQACDNGSCLPPKDLAFDIAVPALPPGGEGRDLHPGIFSKLSFKTAVK